MKFAYVLSSLTLFLFLTPPTYAQTMNPAPASTVEFEAVGRPSMLKVKGHGAKLRGVMAVNGAAAKGKFEINMNDFTTDIDLRDKHMRETYLETAKHPKATLDITSVELPAGWKKGQTLDSKFKGNLTVKGVSKPIEGTFKSDAAMKTEAAFTVKLSDFNINPPKYMGITIADIVNVKATIPSFSAK